MMRWRTYPHQFLNIPIVLPPLDTQKNIVKDLKAKIEAIEKLIELKGKIIKENESYKKSLIYEYVTGKKEVGEEVE